MTNQGTTIAEKIATPGNSFSSRIQPVIWFHPGLLQRRNPTTPNPYNTRAAGPLVNTARARAMYTAGHHFFLPTKSTIMVAQMAAPTKQLKNTSMDERRQVPRRSGEDARQI